MGMSIQSGKSKRQISDINITPLVDVMLVLLIIFMVTAPMMQQGVEVQLPETKATGIQTSDKPFVLSIKKNGQIFIDKTPYAMTNLEAKLKTTYATRSDKSIYIQADKKVEYGIVAEAMSEVRAAGIKNINLVTVPMVNR
jgi:biopolymer transport protein TolR